MPVSTSKASVRNNFLTEGRQISNQSQKKVCFCQNNLFTKTAQK